jgi:hypothetical protein
VTWNPPAPRGYAGGEVELALDLVRDDGAEERDALDERGEDQCRGLNAAGRSGWRAIPSAALPPIRPMPMPAPMTARPARQQLGAECTGRMRALRAVAQRRQRIGDALPQLGRPAEAASLVTEARASTSFSGHSTGYHFRVWSAFDAKALLFYSRFPIPDD